jgi:DNA-binding phage protein
MTRAAKVNAKSRSTSESDKYVKDRMKDSTFAAQYQKVAAEIEATDGLVQALDSARIANRMSKAELARRISAKPEIVRRLFTSRSANPTMSTVIAVTKALGFHLTLVPNRKPPSRRRAADLSKLRGTRDRNSRPSLRTSS